eukprot:1156094-Pelagomonas_calceolata.AAC.8
MELWESMVRVLAEVDVALTINCRYTACSPIPTLPNLHGFLGLYKVDGCRRNWRTHLWCASSLMCCWAHEEGATSAAIQCQAATLPSSLFSASSIQKASVGPMKVPM